MYPGAPPPPRANICPAPFPRRVRFGFTSFDIRGHFTTSAPRKSTRKSVTFRDRPPKLPKIPNKTHNRARLIIPWSWVQVPPGPPFKTPVFIGFCEFPRITSAYSALPRFTRYSVTFRDLPRVRHAPRRGNRQPPTRGFRTRARHPARTRAKSKSPFSASLRYSERAGDGVISERGRNASMKGSCCPRAAADHSVFGSSSSASSSVGVSSISMRLTVVESYTPNAETELVVV